MSYLIVTQVANKYQALVAAELLALLNGARLY